MATKGKAHRGGNAPASYLRLVRDFPLASIRSEKQLDAAQEVIDGLLVKGMLDAGEELYLDALSDLLAAYEDEHYPIAPAADADMLRHLLDAKGITQAELHRQTAIPKSSISEVLAGKKPLSRALIRTLSKFFQVEPGVLAANL